VLHNEQPLFEQIILRTSEDTGIEASIIEKDYYVTLFLRQIAAQLPSIIFKGGTSLSKCYKLINRFSEDIDLNIETEAHPTEGQRKKLKEVIVSLIDGFGFTLTNPDNIRSRRDYNRYIIDYPTIFRTGCLKEHLIVETAVYIKAYPCKRMMASSMICDYLDRSGYRELIEQYDLQPFALNVQSAERTLIDKVFAVGDYYLSGAIHEHSRHIYDIYKLLDTVALDGSMKTLVKSVREERKPHVNCRSAKDGVDMNTLLQEIIDKAVYKQDYEDITARILFEELPYEIAAAALRKVIESGIFSVA
jgi:hypothetical protein